jgi:putative hydrolase of the HAD superfamily
MAKKKISTILFDFGNVLLPIDVEATYNAFKKLGAKPSLHKELPLFHKWERGEIDEDEFIAEIRNHISIATHASSVWSAWNAMIMDFPHTHLSMLKSLKKKYTLILVSNINHEHERFIKQKMGCFVYAQFLRQFSAVYYSHYMGLRKPEEAFFKTVLKETGTAKNQAFFVDDTEANIAVAEKLGITSWFFNPEKDSILDLPKKLKSL